MADTPADPFAVTFDDLRPLLVDMLGTAALDSLVMRAQLARAQVALAGGPLSVDDVERMAEDLGDRPR